MATMASLIVEVGANIGKFVGEMTRMEAQADRATRNIRRSFQSMAAQVGVAFSAGLFAKFIKDNIDLQDQVYKMSQKIGVSVESLSGLRYAAKLSGAGLEDLEKAFKTLSQRMIEANDSSSRSAALMKALGVDIAGGPEAALYKLADAFSTMRDGTTKTALAVELFGKSGMNLIPFLNQGAAGIKALQAEAERLGITMTTEGAQAAEKYNDNLESVKLSVESLAVSLTNNFGGSLVSITKAMKQAAEEGSALGVVASALGGVFAEVLGLNPTQAQESQARLRDLHKQIASLETLVSEGPGLVERMLGLDQTDRLKGKIAELRREVASIQTLEDAVAGKFDDQATRRARQGRGKPQTDRKDIENILADAARKAAEEAKRLRELDAAGWVKYIDDLQRQWDEEAKAFADTQEEMRQAAERLRTLDEAGWVKYIEELQRRWDEEAANFAAAQDEKRARETAAWSGYLDSIESGFRDAWDEMLSFQKGSWQRTLDSLKSMFQRTLVDFIYQSLAKPFVLRMVAGAADFLGMGGLAGAAGNAAQAATTAQGALSFANIAAGASALLPSGAAGVAFSNVAQMGWGALGGSGALGSIIGQVASFIPVVGTLIAGITLLANFFKDGPENPNFRWVQGLGGEGAFGGIKGEGNYANAALEGFLESINKIDTRISAFLSPEQVERITQRLAQYTNAGRRFDGQPAQFAFPPGTDAEAMQQLGIEVLKSRYGAVFDELNPRFAEMIKGFEGTAEELAKMIEGMVAFYETMQAITSSDALTAAASIVEDAEHAFSAALRNNASAFESAMEGFDAGTVTLEQLTQATASYYTAQVQLLAQLRVAANEIGAMFGDTIRSIEIAALDSQGKYNYLQAEADRLQQQLLSSTDIGEIQRLAQRINADINEAFGLLSPEDQARMAAAFIERINATNAAVQAHIQDITDDVANATEDAMSKLTALMQQAATDSKDAAAKMLSAGELQVAAASTPQEVRVRVDLANNTSEVGA